MRLENRWGTLIAVVVLLVVAPIAGASSVQGTVDDRSVRSNLTATSTDDWPDNQRHEVELGETVDGEINTNDDTDRFAVPVSAGQVINLTWEKSRDVSISFNGPGFYVDPDDADQGYRRVLVDSDGRMRIDVGGSAPEEAKPWSFSTAQIGTDDWLDGQRHEASLGETVDGTIVTSGDDDDFTVPVSAGQVINLSWERSEDVSVSFNGPGFYADPDDSNRGYRRVLVDSDGQMRIDVDGSAPETAKQWSFSTVQIGTDDWLDGQRHDAQLGETIRGTIVTSGDNDDFSVPVSAGQVLNLSWERSEDVSISFNWPGGYADASDDERTYRRITIDSDGRIRIDVDGTAPETAKPWSIGLDVPAPSLSDPGDLRIRVRDEDGRLASETTVILYTEEWTVVGSRTTVDGSVTWADLAAGTYHVEVYDGSEFWGTRTVDVPAGTSTTTTVRRVEPYHRRTVVTDAGDGDGQFEAGEPITISSEVANNRSFPRDVRVTVYVDRDRTRPWDGTVQRGPIAIASDDTGWFGYEFTPPANGSYHVRVRVETNVNGQWVVTDRTDWTTAFTVGSASDRELIATVREFDDSDRVSVTYATGAPTTVENETSVSEATGIAWTDLYTEAGPGVAGSAATSLTLLEADWDANSSGTRMVTANYTLNRLRIRETAETVLVGEAQAGAESIAIVSVYDRTANERVANETTIIKQVYTPTLEEQVAVAIVDASLGYLTSGIGNIYKETVVEEAASTAITEVYAVGSADKLVTDQHETTNVTFAAEAGHSYDIEIRMLASVATNGIALGGATARLEQRSTLHEFRVYSQTFSDTEPPRVTRSIPGETDQILDPNNVTFELTASDTQAATSDLDYSYRVLNATAESSWSGWIDVPSDGEISRQFDLSSGQYTVAFRVRDPAGNVERVLTPIVITPPAEITSFEPEDATYTAGEEISADVTVRNAGSVSHTYFVGYGAIGPNGGIYDNDGTTGTPLTLAPGETRTVTVSLTVEEGFPAGRYDLVTAVWNESDRESLHVRVDSVTTRDAISVESDADLPTVRVEPSTPRLGQGTTATVDLVIRNATGQGVGSYDLNVSVGNTSTARIRDVSDGIGGTVQAEIADDGSTARIAAFNGETADSGAVTVATVSIRGVDPGTTTLRVTTTTVSDEEGVLYTLGPTPDATVTVTEQVAPDVTNDGNPARDPDGDGAYEDVNGDGTVAPGDATVLFDAIFAGNSAVVDNPDLFDFNDDGRLAAGDATVLFDEVFGARSLATGPPARDPT